MQLTPATVAMILAFTSSTLAAPHLGGREAAVDSAIVPKSTDSGSATSVTKRSGGVLSVTQQLLRADLAAERFDILKDDKDFKFPMWPVDIPEGHGGALKAANRKTFPALVGSKGAMTVGRIKPCGINTFHVHPRSAELQMVISGELVTEMVPENGVRPIRNTIKPFEMTAFYQGSVHHQFNPKCEEAIFVAAFPTEDPGTGQVVNEVFELDQGALVDTLGKSFTGDMAKKIKQNLPEAVVQGVETCLAECGGKVGLDEEKKWEGQKGESKSQDSDGGKSRGPGKKEGAESEKDGGGKSQKSGGEKSEGQSASGKDEAGIGHEAGTEVGGKVGTGVSSEFDGKEDGDLGYDVAQEIGDEVGAEVGEKIGGEIVVQPEEGGHLPSKHWVGGGGGNELDDDVAKEIGGEVGSEVGGSVGGGIGSGAPAGGHLPSESSSSRSGHSHHSHGGHWVGVGGGGGKLDDDVAKEIGGEVGSEVGGSVGGGIGSGAPAGGHLPSESSSSRGGHSHHSHGGHWVGGGGGGELDHDVAKEIGNEVGGEVGGAVGGGIGSGAPAGGHLPSESSSSRGEYNHEGHGHGSSGHDHHSGHGHSRHSH